MTSIKNVILISGLAALALAGAGAGARAADEARKVSVSGSCSRQVAPDRGAIVVTAEVREPDLKVASQKAIELYERARESIKRLRLENLDLRTSEYGVTRLQEWEKGKAIAKGYKARMGLRVATSDIQKLGEVIAIAAREGLQDVGQLSTFLSEEKARREQAACLEDAAQNAKAKAEKLAGSLGAKLGVVLAVSETAASGPMQPMDQAPVMATFRGGEGAAPAPSVEAGQQTLSVSVLVTFGLY